MIELFSTLSKWMIPMFILVVMVSGQLRKVNVFETFVDGAKEGFWLSIRLIPYVLAVYVAFGILRESGGLHILVVLLSPLLRLFGIPPEVVPLMIVRPLSGPASLGLTVNIMEYHGPDSLIGKMAATIDGSTDTTLYIMALYFGAVGIKHVRYAMVVGLAADITAFVAAVFFVKWIF